MLIFVITLCAIDTLTAQSLTKDKNDCIDSCNYCNLYNIIIDNHLPYIELKNENQKHFQISQEPAGHDFDIKCDEINLDNKGSDELLIFWKNSAYGSGGGSSYGGIQIYNLDSGKRIFNEITFFSLESFHRPPTSPASYISCKIDVNITEMQISIGHKRFEARWIDSLNYQNGWETEYISKLNKGVYFFSNDTLKMKKE